MTPKSPIGVFDSGVGGLSVLKEIRKQLPRESILYFADSANCPYGTKTRTRAFSLARKNICFLIDQGCKLIVIACNTVTAVAIDEFRKSFSLPFVGMEPAVKPAVRATRTGKVGVLATQNTFKGRLFKQTLEKYAKGVDVFVQPGCGLVELVEQGGQNSEQARQLLETYLGPMIEKGADTLVLGCTHYPFLIQTIRDIAGDHLTIIDPSGAVAVQTRRVLTSLDLICEDPLLPEYRFYTTGEPEMTDQFLSQTLDVPYDLKKVAIG